MHSWKRRAFMLLLSCIMLLALGPVGLTANLEHPKTVRVAYFSDGNFMSRNKSGEYIGFTFEYLYTLSKYVNWKYEIVDCGSWEGALEKAAAGEVDLVPDAYYATEREEILLYPTLPMCIINSTLITRVEDNRYSYEDFSSFNGMRVGVVSSGLDGLNLQEYSKKNGFDVELIAYGPAEEMLGALRRGELDGVAITQLGRSNAFRSVAQFSPGPTYLTVPRGETVLLAELEEGITKLNLYNVGYQSMLYNKYFAVNATQEPVFTAAELRYLEENPVVSAVYDSSWLPLSYLDPQTGAFSGAVSELFALISSYSGLQFDFIPSGTYQSALEATQDDTVNVICAVSNDYLSGHKNKLKSTQNYLRMPVVLLSQGTGKPIRTIAAPRIISEDVLGFTNFGETLRHYDTAEQCFDAVIRGEADAIFLSTYVASHWLAYPRYHGFSVTTLTNYAEEISVGVSNTADPRLYSILDKCVQFVATEQMDRFILSSATAPREITLRDMLSQNPVGILSGITIGASAVILLLVGLLALNAKRKQHIEQLLYLDNLTGLWNLNKFCTELNAQLKVERRNPMALLYLDIKQFSTINDTLGFGEGDVILQAVANILKQDMGEGELCARAAADHFVLLLREESIEALERRTTAIDEAFARWAVEAGKTYRLVLVFGLYLVEGMERRDASLLLDFANHARRSAQMLHRSHMVQYDGAMRQQELQQRTLADRMQFALEQGEFIPYYQPKVDVHTGCLTGSEALVRWCVPDEGLLPPGQFIPLFEKNGFIVEMDFYIFRCICKAMRRWMDAGLTVYPVSCNFSRLHLDATNFAERLVSIADEHAVPYRYLELEVTESVFMNNMDEVAEQFRNLQALGFPLSIDDFGSGYSSLGMLQQCAVDVLKLDRTFIVKGMLGQREQTVVRGVVDMARCLDMAVVCEGVETAEQVRILKEIGCNTAQGYYYARPMPEADFEALLKNPILG